MSRYSKVQDPELTRQGTGLSCLSNLAYILVQRLEADFADVQGAAAAEDEHRLQAIKTVRGAMSLLAMVAVAHPDAAVVQLDTILEVQSIFYSLLANHWHHAGSLN